MLQLTANLAEYADEYIKFLIKYLLIGIAWPLWIN